MGHATDGFMVSIFINTKYFYVNKDFDKKKNSMDNFQGTIETLLSGAICGVVYHLFAGQPLTIIGATGPLLVFESIIYAVCTYVF